MNAPDDPAVPLRQRPGIKDEPEWMDMIDKAKDGTWTDWKKWNEKYLDVAWSNVLFRQYNTTWNTNRMNISFDAEGAQYIETVGIKV